MPLPLFDRLRRRQEIIVVSGLPRSGTSMMTAMLAAGGVEVFSDAARAADADNPRGYFEHERVKRLRQEDPGWLRAARGKAIKVVAPLLDALPPGHRYRVLFMRRDLGEVLASQRAMLVRRGTDPDKIDDATLETLYRRQLAALEGWLAVQRHIQVLDVDYARAIAEPAVEAARVADFLDRPLDREAMAAVADPGLYRQRRGGAR
ncbi:sulfotransferase domain-containing protein [Marichromatium gracile]|uniref:Sulfotransferase domain-containing protein n=1 Tax=Marichromatium gracile TaxID=1048 RepID=A0A4V6P4T4_MARGR|nr:sulfotransferase domain-containing protein [Marichromatium gracile]MBK1710068.1 hypothetical protein [Marichromatium gracile]TCW38170.1 sulfotransferase domain-containing protein [Marichromatium gracile]